MNILKDEEEVAELIRITEEDGDSDLSDDDDEADGTTELTAVTGDTKKRLLEFQKKFISSLVANFDKRIIS